MPKIKRFDAVYDRSYRGGRWFLLDDQKREISVPFGGGYLISSQVKGRKNALKIMIFEYHECRKKAAIPKLSAYRAAQKAANRRFERLDLIESTKNGLVGNLKGLKIKQHTILTTPMRWEHYLFWKKVERALNAV